MKPLAIIFKKDKLLRLFHIFLLQTPTLFPHAIGYFFYKENKILRIATLLLGAGIVCFPINNFCKLILRDIKFKRKQEQSRNVHSDSFGMLKKQPFSFDCIYFVFFVLLASGYIFAMIFWGYVLNNVDPITYFSLIGEDVYNNLDQLIRKRPFVEEACYFLLCFFPIAKLYHKVKAIE